MNNKEKEAAISCIVVDDEPLAARLISSYVERTPFLTLQGEAHSAEEAITLFGKGAPEVAFLDIRMPHLSGMQLARVLPPNVKTVFTTAYSDHAVEGFRVGAIDYLLKPVSYEDFLQAAQRVREIIETERRAATPPVVEVTARSEFLTVKSEYRLLRIPTDCITYIEGLKDYVKIFTTEQQAPVLSLMSLKQAEEALPQPPFMRVHRSYIVNTDKIRLIERNAIMLNGNAIPVSESYRRKFLDLIGAD